MKKLIFILRMLNWLHNGKRLVRCFFKKYFEEEQKLFEELGAIDQEERERGEYIG